MNAPMNNIPLLVAALRAAKAVEDDAVAQRKTLQAQLVSLITQPGLETTFKGEGFQIAYKLDRKVDAEMLWAAYPTLSLNAQKAFRFKADVDLKAYRALEEFDAPAFKTISAFVTTKPATPTVTLSKD